MSDELALRTRSNLPASIRTIIVLGLLYLFLVGVKLLEGGIKGLGESYTDALFDSVSNPLAGLFAGILVTVLVQSSSVTTSTIVGLVASGVISVDTAVPMIMGANIGTTVTNTLVSLTHARQTEQFRAAFTAATMHDFFNVIVVIVLLPLEILTGFLSKTAALIAHVFVDEGVGGSFDSPIKSAVGWFASAIQDVVERVIANETVLGVVGIGLAIAIIFFTLSFISKNMRLLVADRIERTLNAALARSSMVGIAVGALVTIAVQSSSITTSILIPLVASGLLLVRNAYPITLGANIGTTITALLAALATGTVGSLTIAFTHTIFNIVGILLIFPWPKIRYVPVIMAEKLADVAIRRKSLALGYTFGVFVVIPALGILVLR